jgi:hypothetical protein
MDLSFLSNVEVQAPEKKERKGRTSINTVPAEGADIRVFGNGKMYPSQAFADKHALEFVPKETVEVEGKDPKTVVVGNGLDIFSSSSWGMINIEQEVIFLAVVPKSAPKVDVWNSTKYDEDGNPKASVFTQGVNTFAKTRLVPMLATSYGVDWDKVDYVDLQVVETQPIVSPTGVYAIPKIVSTGERKGEADYVRRENINVCPVIVVEATEATDTAGATQEDAGEDWAAQLGKPANADA